MDTTRKKQPYIAHKEKTQIAVSGGIYHWQGGMGIIWGYTQEVVSSFLGAHNPYEWIDAK